MRVPNPSPELDRSRAPKAPDILSSGGAGGWRKAPKVFPDSNSVLEKSQSVKQLFRTQCAEQGGRQKGVGHSPYYSVTFW